MSGTDRPHAVDLAEVFEDRFGAPPDGLWAAPGRVNLIGEHTDYNDGFVLPLAIDRQTTVALRFRDDDLARCQSVQQADPFETRLGDVAPGAVSGWAAYPLGVAWVLRDQGTHVPGFDLLVQSDVPVGSGLSSSAALECAVGLALLERAGGPVDGRALALAAQRAEVEVVGAPVGVMDQMASVCGTARHALFLDCRTLEVEQVPMDLQAAGLVLLVVDTRVQHSNADGGYGARRRACEQAARILGVPALRDATAEQLAAHADELGDERLRRARHVVTENARVLEAVELLRAGRFDALGPLLASSHASLRDDYEVSVPELDLAVSASLAAGATGARLTGAGFGGCALALVPQELVSAVTDGVLAAFAEHGHGTPRVFPVLPSDGAHVVDAQPAL